jgi:hypothetical protein
MLLFVIICGLLKMGNNNGILVLYVLILGCNRMILSLMFSYVRGIT